MELTLSRGYREPLARNCRETVFPQVQPPPPPGGRAGFPPSDQICAAARHGIALFRGTLARRHGAIFLPPLLPLLSPLALSGN